MLLKTAFVRFYKSFNYDYLRKHSEDAKAHQWDFVKGAFYPYVRVPVDSHVTTVVGANESGKSHLLHAIEHGVHGHGIKSSDFCRCSHFFGVVEGEVRQPDFGIEWMELSEEEKKAVREACGVPTTRGFTRFLMFRTNDEGCVIYLPNEADYTRHSLTAEQANVLGAFLPHTFRIEAKVALPASVEIRDLAPEVFGASPSGELLTRERRFGVLSAAGNILSQVNGWLGSPDGIANSAASIKKALTPLVPYAPKADKHSEAERAQRHDEIALARDLIRKVAKIDPQALKELYEALRDSREGHVSGLINRINEALAAHLNFPQFWAQDRAFALVVSPREHDLVFTIRDRTGTEYSFNERSSGLRYFLSYYVQYLAHEPSGPDTEILLMDEPDAYLSSQAQHDLLKVFHAFASPEGSRRRVQVVYVTHSPFLIDKNYADRIRVLEKGVGDEGTRVVRDVARNHYEPLRSAFGAFVGETAFIGNCNLMVEGTADQILLAGVASLLRSRTLPESETLDLNRITVVPTGGASQVPYLVYLARGRDVERPAVVVLLDSDQSGNEARQALRKGAPRGKSILNDAFVLQIGELKKFDEKLVVARTEGAQEIEDLIPLALCAEALREYAIEFWEATPAEAAGITTEKLTGYLKDGRSTFDAIEEFVKSLGAERDVNKVAFARSVIAAATATIRALQPPQEGTIAVEALFSNFRILLRKLNDLIRRSEKERSTERVTQKVHRLIRTFFLDHPETVTREKAGIMLRDIEESLDQSVESDFILAVLPTISREFKLGEDVLKPVENFLAFRQRVENIRYASKLGSQEAAPPVTPEYASPAEAAIASEALVPK